VEQVLVNRSGPFGLQDRVAIVTGAGRGLGAAIATTFAQAGADVVIASRTQEQLEAVASTVAEFGRRAVVLPMDVGADDAADRLVAAAMSEFGRIDCVVNNAGGAYPRPFLDTSPRYLDESFHFNVTTAFALTRAATPHLLASDNGSVLNITSAIGRLRDRGYAAYGTAKAALAHLTRLLSADLAPRVRVNGIAPGAIATSALDIVAGDDAMREQVESKTPLGRLGKPEEIAYAALYLASPAGAYVTGKILEVDGGIEAANLDLGLPDLQPGS
jgi:7-alpha-hydroxysteroid dehydrogenase